MTDPNPPTDPLSDAALAELARLAAAATPGPWIARRHHRVRCPSVATGKCVANVVTKHGPMPWKHVAGDSGCQFAHDAEFIAATRTALPALLSKLARWRAASALPLESLEAVAATVRPDAGRGT